MNSIYLYILKKYGYKLTNSELESVLTWYKYNLSKLQTEEELDCEIRVFLRNSFPNKMLFLQEEDTSNMNYLLSLLSKEIHKEG